MSLRKCKECGHDVSTEAKSCPSCGAVTKKKTGCIGCGILLLLGFIFLFVMIGILDVDTDTSPIATSKESADSETSSSNRKSKENEVYNVDTDTSPTATSKESADSETSSSNRKSKENEVYSEGETVNIGYTSYAVWDSWWSRHLSDNEFLDEPPNAMYLFVRLTVRNDDKKARMVPPLSLYDENGAEYETSNRSWAVEGAIGILEELNPSVSKQGFIVFDVPTNRTYRLKLSGGYWSSEEAYVLLEPDATK